MRLTSLGVLVALVVALPDAAAAQWGGRYSSETRMAMEALGTTPVPNLPIPVLLGIEVNNLTKNFADPRAGGARTHEGLDILAPSGTPIAAPTDSVVTSTGNGTNSGLYVRAAAPGSETHVYMHLSAIASGVTRGTVLKRGDIIGFVGNTGNASAGPAHLHFEIRANRVATDPYPRLTLTFTLHERMSAVTQALEKGASAETLVSKFRSTFVDARSQGIPLSQSILTLLDTIPPPPPTSGPPTDVPTPGQKPLDPMVAFGESNTKIVELQKFLIQTASGPAATRLRNSTATGYFGSVTLAALIEYQVATNLAATGVVDAVTHAHVFPPPNEGDSSDMEEEGDTASTTPYVFTRDLEMGMRGEDVRELQRYLNAHGFIITETGDGSPGHETTYFGSLTRAALVRYQLQKGIVPAAGYFGPKTRASIAV